MAQRVECGAARLRLAARVAVLAAVVLLSVPLVSWTPGLLVLPAASPFVGVASAVATRTVGAVALIAVPLLVVACLRARWFCRWACPVGLVSETLGRARRASTPRLARWPAVGQWIVLATLGGACLGYPVLLWTDPLAILSGFLGVWRWPLTVASVLAAMGLPAVLVVSLIVPHAWCGRLCPLGGMQDLLAVPWRLMRDRFRRRRAAAVASSRGPVPALARRAVLGLGVGAAGTLAVRLAGGAGPPLRPPGAADEDRFNGLCVRCGNCVRACPTGILRPDLGGSGVAGLLTPVVVFESGYCREDCRACGQVCPSGAIARLSLEAKRRRVIGRARVTLTACLLAGGQECTSCLVACPFEAIARVESTVASAPYDCPHVDVTKCNGCGACEAACPTAPPRAMRVFPVAADPAGRSGR